MPSMIQTCPEPNKKVVDPPVSCGPSYRTISKEPWKIPSTATVIIDKVPPATTTTLPFQQQHGVHLAADGGGGRRGLGLDPVKYKAGGLDVL